MATLIHLEGRDTPPNSSSGSEWTLITNRSKAFKPGNQSSPITKEATGRMTSQQAETATTQPRGTTSPVTVDLRQPNKSSQFQSSLSKQHGTRLGPPVQIQGNSDDELIGDPDVLFGDYKRKRKQEFLTSDEEDTSSSESELESLDNDSDSVPGSKYGSDYDESESASESEPEEADSSTHYPYPRRAIVESIYKLFVIWMRLVRYIIPPEHRLKRRKNQRAKRARMFIEETDPNDPSSVFISAFDGYYHLACPFYRYNPNRYHTCTITHSLNSIESLVVHTLHHHVEPPLCRICGKDFDNFKDRNDHIRNETCETPGPEDKEFHMIKGVTQVQRVKILKRDNPHRTEEERWTRIYKTIFESEPVGSPYLTEGKEFKFSLLHDYWKSKGKECVRQYLTDNGHSRQGGDRPAEFAKLCSLVLEDLRKKVQDEDGSHGGKE